MKDFFKNELSNLRDSIVSFTKSIKHRNNRPSDERELAVIRDVGMVGFSSNILEISEFRFFQLAYTKWYGRELPEKSMEPYFTEYMFDNIVPHWVRDMSRRVMSRYKEGSLDPAEFNIHHPVAVEHVNESRVPNIAFMILLYMICSFILFM